MATKQPRGLGGSGLDRARRNIGQPDHAQHADEDLYRGSPPLQQTQPLRTGWIEVDSTRLAAYNYDYSTGSLYVRWKNNGTIWEYENVSSAIFETFASSPSMGRYVNSTLNLTHYHQIHTGDIP